MISSLALLPSWKKEHKLWSLQANRLCIISFPISSHDDNGDEEEEDEDKKEEDNEEHEDDDDGPGGGGGGSSGGGGGVTISLPSVLSSAGLLLACVQPPSPLKKSIDG